MFPAKCVTRALGLHMALVIELIGVKYFDVLPWIWYKPKRIRCLALVPIL